MITITAYETNDGRRFTDREKALDHEKALIAKNEEQEKLKTELDAAHDEMKKALKKASDAYTEYLKAFDNYSTKHENYYEKYPQKKSSKNNFDSFLDEMFSLFNIN